MFLGIDAAKAPSDAALIKGEPKPRHKIFANTLAGHQQLLSWPGDNGAQRVHAGIQATGTYAQALALALHEAGHRVSSVNPGQIRALGQSHLSRAKTGLTLPAFDGQWVKQKPILAARIARTQPG